MYEPATPPDQLDAERERLLKEGLGERGAQGGRIGAQIGGVIGGSGGGRLMGAAGAAGGRAGARLAVLLVRTRHHEEPAELPADREAAATVARDVLEHLGRAVRTEAMPGGGLLVRGVVGAGALDLNPAVVDVRIPAGGGVTVRAAAKEGLIPQRTARGAVRRVIGALYSVAPPS